VCLLPFAAAAAAEAPAPTPDSRYIDLGQLIDRVAKRTGKEFVLDPRVRADIPLAGMDPAKVDYERLLAILRVNQFVAVEEKGFVIIVPDANARQMPTPTYTDLKFKALNDELVTVLLEGRNTCAASLVPLLRPLLPQAAHLAADLNSNTMLISDRADNARRVGDLFERLDRAAPPGQKCSPTGSSK
jgi:general secretion pathway protein D